MIDDLPRPVLTLDTSLRVAAVNTTAEEWWGRAARALIGMPVADILPGLAESSFSRVAASRAPLEVREAVQNPAPADATVFMSGDRLAVVLYPTRATSGQTTRSGELDTLGQMIGHEIKNPLAGIAGAAQLLREDVGRDGQDLLDLIVAETDRVRRLAERLQTFGEVEAGDSSSVNIHNLLRQARNVVALSGETALFTEDYDPSLPHVYGDPDLLMQVVVNLIKNAAEAGGEEIVLRTRSRSGVRRNSRMLPVEVQIIDTGPGIPAHLRDHVFRPFVSSKSSGQGLGLPLVAKVVEGHGGLVELDSRPGHTRFSLLLPAAA